MGTLIIVLTYIAYVCIVAVYTFKAVSYTHLTLPTKRIV